MTVENRAEGRRDRDGSLALLRQLGRPHDGRLPERAFTIRLSSRGICALSHILRQRITVRCTKCPLPYIAPTANGRGEGTVKPARDAPANSAPGYGRKSMNPATANHCAERLSSSVTLAGACALTDSIARRGVTAVSSRPPATRLPTAYDLAGFPSTEISATPLPEALATIPESTSRPAISPTTGVTVPPRSLPNRRANATELVAGRTRTSDACDRPRPAESACCGQRRIQYVALAASSAATAKADSRGTHSAPGFICMRSIITHRPFHEKALTP